MRSSEKLPIHTDVPERRRDRDLRTRALLYLKYIVGCLIGLYIGTYLSKFQRSRQSEHAAKTFQCPQFLPRQVNSSLPVKLGYDAISSPMYRQQSAELLSRAVQVPSITYDDLGPVGVDARWQVFADLAHLLSSSFPRVHAQLTLETVNSHALLYTWQGSNEALKPVVLMAHQDVVPVDSLNKWTYPPFSGHIDETYVHGRGSSDCKNVLIGILESVENLLAAGFKPERTIVLSFGFDEETKGTEGALQLSRRLEEIYGANGVELILDEGAGFTEIYGQVYASPGIAEKGYLDATITVTMPGGHSSIPSDHTSIGVLSEILVAVEQAPYKVKLKEHNPLYQSMVCAAKYSPSLPGDLKKLLKKNKLTALASALRSNLEYRYLMATSVAETVINGGVKVNALPETATAVVNHRISIDEDTSFVEEKLTSIVRRIAKRHSLTLHAFDKSEPSMSSIHLANGLDTLDPAPITPIDTEQYAVLSGTIRSVFPNVLVAPGMSTGNTDTKSMWNLTRHIYRFEPSLDGYLEGANIHTINERMSITGHLELVRFYYQFIQNVQAPMS